MSYPEHSPQRTISDGPDTRPNGESLDVTGPLLDKTPAPPTPADTAIEMTNIGDRADGSLRGSNEHLNMAGGRRSDGPVSWSMYIERVEEFISAFMVKHNRCIWGFIKGTLFLAYMIYFFYCMNYRFGDEGSLMLVAATVILLLTVLHRLLSGRCSCSDRLVSLLTFPHRTRLYMRYGLYVVALVGLAGYLGFGVFIHNPQNAQSLLGVVGIIFFCFVLSQKPSRVNWHPVFWGFVVQFCCATFTLQTKVGHDGFMWLGGAIQRLLEYSHSGAAFVIGKDFKSMGLAFGYAGVLIFFGSLMGLLIHFGVIGFLVVKGGRALAYAMDTGPVESVIAVANIFIGMSSAPLLILPYLPTMSLSELGALMTCGFASVSGDMMALFIASGAPANHLLTAAIISAPAALAVAKLLMPETEHVDLTAQSNISAAGIGGEENQNALSAASDGALVAIRLVVSSMVNMLAFVSLLSLIDAILAFFGERAGISGLTFDSICGYVLFPLAFAMGAPYEDCSRVGSLIGIKLFATPVVGYAELGKIIDNRMVLEEYVNNENGTWHWQGTDVILEATNTTLVHGVMSERAEVITTYAMCGFSAFTAIGICIGALTSLCPARKMDVIKLIPPAFLGGNMASFATGAMAGLLHSVH